MVLAEFLALAPTRAPPAAPSPQAEAAAAPKQLHGWTLAESQYVAEYDSQVLLYRHDKTGAQLMSVANVDENKTFGVTFRTPVANSRGVPHILEHSGGWAADGRARFL
jgi:hypothetical protein